MMCPYVLHESLERKFLQKNVYQTTSKPIRLLNEALFLVMTGTIGPALYLSIS
jgi:hypothetical protein